MSHRLGWRVWRELLLAALLTAAWSTALAQTTINVPPSFSPSSIGAGTTLNLLNGGSLGTLIANAGSTVNILGGEAYEIGALVGSTVQVTGGQTRILQITGSGAVAGGGIGSLFNWEGAQTIISGGAIDDLGARAGATVGIQGTDFRVNGIPVAGLAGVGDVQILNLTHGDVLTGVLADGTAFAHDQNAFAEATQLAGGSLRLIRSADPPPPVPGVVDVATQSALRRVGAGQTVRVLPGGSLDQRFRAGPGSRVEIAGGSVGLNFHAVGSVVEITDGNLAHAFNAYEGTVLNLRGGVVNDSVIYRNAILNIHGGEFYGNLRPGATMNVDGGVVGRVYGQAGSTANFSGGIIQEFASEGHAVVTGGNFARFNVQQGKADVSGGAFDGDGFEIRIGAQLTLGASEFKLNGAPLANLGSLGDTRIIALGASDILSGVFPDGVPFVFSGGEGRIEEPITLKRLADYAPGPAVIEVPTEEAPAGVHAGQTLILRDGGAIPRNFTAIDATVQIEGGSVGSDFDLLGGAAHITGGSLLHLDAYQGALVNLSGDASLDNLRLFAGATANVAGGKAGSLKANQGSTLNIAGGDFGGPFESFGAHVNISGGTFNFYQQKSHATAGSVVTLTGGSTDDLRISEGSTLLASGGVIATLEVGRQSLAALTGAEVDFVIAGEQSTVRLEAGSVEQIDNLGGTIRISGGGLGDNHEWIAGTTELYGYDFAVDGVPIAGLVDPGNRQLFKYAQGTTFTGVLADGTPFIMSPSELQHVFHNETGTTWLNQTAPPLLPSNVTIPADSAPAGAAAGQHVVLLDGGRLPANFTAGPQSTVVVQGGTVGKNFEAYGSDVVVDAGAIGEGLDVFDGAQVHVSGGTVARHWEVHRGGQLNLSGGYLDHEGRIVGGTFNVAGGTVGSSLQAIAGATVNISGGIVGSELRLRDGSTVNVSGGQVGSNFRVENFSVANVTGGRLEALELGTEGVGVVSGGVVNALQVSPNARVEIRGGAFGDAFSISSAANGAIFGNDFRLDGAPIDELLELLAPGDEATVAVSANQLLSGTLADGTPFAFMPSEGGVVGSYKLRYATHAAGPSTINVPFDVAPLGVHAGQHLTLAAGGSLGDNFVVGAGSVVDIQGGVVGQNMEAVGSLVTISGGSVGGNFDAFAGSQVHIRGGIVGTNLDVHSGASVSLDGGIAFGIDALAGGNLAVTGGKLNRLATSNGSKTVWSGGVVDGFAVNGSNALEIVGADFRINNAVVAGLNNVGDSTILNLPFGSVLTGTLADGTPLILNLNNSSPIQFASGSTRLVRSDAPPTPQPSYQIVDVSPGPFAAGADQTIDLRSGGLLTQNFIAGPGSKLIVNGGSVLNGLQAFDAELIVTSGQTGGMTLLSNSRLELYGGSVPGAGLSVHAGASVDLFGTQFLINGQPLAGLAAGASQVISLRGNQRLSAVLTDGSTFEMFLASLSSSRPLSGISSAATLTVHLIPEPRAVALAAVGFTWRLACRRRSSAN